MPIGGSWSSALPDKAPSSLLDLAKPLCGELISQLDMIHLVVFYGEPGLGLGDIQDCFLRLLVMEGRSLHTYSGNKVNPTKTSDSLVRFARKIVRDESPACSVVVIQQLPASDEMETRRQVKAIKRILDAGFSVALSLEPQSCTLLEFFDVYRLLDTKSLADYVRDVDTAAHCHAGCLELSRGIPQLYLALLNSAFVVDGFAPIRYMERLSDAVSLSVGPGLTDEETEFRLYLHLLGTGSLEDVEKDLGFKVRELFQELGAQSSLFGVSLREGTFLTLAEQAKLPLDYLFDSLRLPLKRCHEVVYRAAGALFQRDKARSVAVAKHLTGELLGLYVMDFGDELLDMGEFSLVRSGLAAARFAEDIDQNMKWALEMALDAMTERRFSTSAHKILTPEYIENFSAGNARARSALLFVDARLRFCGEVREGYELDSTIDTSQARLRLHANVFRHIIRGELSEAIELFVGNSFACQQPTISSSLLALDAELIRLMNCDSLASGGIWFNKSRDFLGRIGQNATLDYLSVVTGLQDLFSDMAEDPGSNYVPRPRLSEDELIKAFMLIEQSFSHMGHGVWTHAVVEAKLAYGALCSTEAQALKDMANLLSCVARDTLGECATVEPDSCVPSMRLIATLVARALDSADDCAPYSLRTRNLHRSNTWFILLLSNGIEPFSTRFDDELFPEWRRALAAARKTVCPAYGMREMAPLVLLEPKDSEDGDKGPKLVKNRPVEKIRINLLGDFSLCIGPRVVDGSRLEQRSSKVMLEFLVLHKRYSAGQAKLFEQLWPSFTYEAAHDRMYQAKSHIRKVLRSVGFTADPFVGGRANGTVGLDPGLVSCDVDELMDKARATITEKDDARTIELALETEGLYSGDLWVPTSDVTGYVTHMAATVKTVYTDALLSGAEAAYKTGRLRVASRLAHSALLTESMREDAEMVLLRALKDSGRGKEAAENYGQFCQNMAEVAGRPPSKQLRALATELALPCELSA